MGPERRRSEMKFKTRKLGRQEQVLRWILLPGFAVLLSLLGGLPSLFWWTNFLGGGLWDWFKEWTVPTLYAQVLVVVEGEETLQLPRPGIWPPRPPFPRPIPPLPPPRPVPPPATYKVDEIRVQAVVRHQTAQVELSQSFLNTGSRQMEVVFVFPLPYDGAVDRMTFLVDGKEIPARLLPAEEARRYYEQIVRRNLDPALLEWIGTGLFRTSVFPVPPGAKRTVSLRYNQLLRLQNGLVDFLFPLSTAKYTSEPLRELSIRVSIESEEEIKNVYCPTHSVQIDRPDPRRAIVRYEARGIVPTSDFRLYYDIGRDLVSGKLLSYRPRSDEDGYFMILVSPSIRAAEGQPVAKTVIFVVDRSGSMSGKKIEQARQAAKQVLSALRPEDLFNIIAYDSNVELFRPELQRFDDTTRAQALGFIDGIYAGGSTNINDALLKALEQIQDPSRPSYIIFLTDGLPTAGVTGEMQIAQNVKNANRHRTRIFVFGVGYDVNARLLDRLAGDNFGTSVYVRPEENIEEAVGRLSQRISLPVLTQAQVRFVYPDSRPEDPPVFYQVYPKGPVDLFAGDQLVLVGRYRRAVAGSVVLTGRLGAQPYEYSFPGQLVSSSPDTTLSFVEKLWATRRVGDILEELDLRGRNEELIKELVQIATRHGILTPYTSFLADEGARPELMAENVRRARERLEAQKIAEGQAGVAQRALAAEMRQAAAAPPAGHFLQDVAGALRAMAPAMPVPGGPQRSLEEEAEQLQRNVRLIADRTFVARNQRWVQADLTQEHENKAIKVQMFSDDFFALVNRYGRRLTQYLQTAEPILLELDGKVYLFEL
jgi:Ca-activated chloride channel family protein